MRLPSPWSNVPSHCWAIENLCSCMLRRYLPDPVEKPLLRQQPGWISKPNNCLNAHLGCGPCRCRTYTQGTKNATSTAPPKQTDGREAEKLKYDRTICWGDHFGKICCIWTHYKLTGVNWVEEGCKTKHEGFPLVLLEVKVRRIKKISYQQTQCAPMGVHTGPPAP